MFTLLANINKSKLNDTKKDAAEEDDDMNSADLLEPGEENKDGLQIH
jgi:hypothetical protein